MSLFSVLDRFRGSAESILVLRDAERIIRQNREDAVAIAADLSWREDAGLLEVRVPGHWHRVLLEVERRTGQGRDALAPRFPGREHVARLQ